MATLALAAAGAAAGGALLPAGISVFGATITGATLGGQIGALAGSVIDQALFGASGQVREVSGPRLADVVITSSTEGAPIPRLYGRARVGGQIIWATDFEEHVVSSEADGGGKGGVGGGGGVTQIEYRYYANFAIGLGQGEISGIGRVWADGAEVDLSDVTFRVYRGDESQTPDSLIEAHEGAGQAPAYRGLAYIVFERLAIGRYGNRIPQLSFEVYRAVDRLHKDIRGVVIIPGSGEFAYATEAVTRTDNGNLRIAENVHTRQANSDWLAGIDQLEAALPNAKSASLVVSWFGTDLNAAQCLIRPGVELADKVTHPQTWQVAGETRAAAHIVSRKDGRPAYGGTPSDKSVVQAIGELKSRGISVTLTPFILMDIATDNTLPDPYQSSGSQPAYPWRGRITVSPAPGSAGSPDKSAAAAAQISSFVGTADVNDFSISGGSVVYNGPAEWSFRRQILHYAWLAKAAGGVDAFVIGSELKGLTTERDAASGFPFVSALMQLAADVKSILGVQTKVTYAADWSEYFGYQPGDGTGDVYFHLDPLWASPDIDAIGIDLYWPLADWRDGGEHADTNAGHRSIYALDYLKGNLAGGEGYDWYYATSDARAEQVRTDITDGLGKPWVFRYKDIRSWWLNAHYNRPGGIEETQPTAWVPQSKPFWFMETGCPAVNKGANEPNVFVDPKSSESKLPHYSSGHRDDYIQRQYLRAIIEAFDPDSSGYVDGMNPTSLAYGGRMVDNDHIHVYAWDSRPYPAFPFDTQTWSDGDNWQLGHWLNGRITSQPLAETVGAILSESGFDDYDTSGLHGSVPGYIADRILSAREALQPLELAFFFDAIETNGTIVFRHRGSSDVSTTLLQDEFVVDAGGGAELNLTRRQETDLPVSAKIIYISATGDYAQAVAEARRLTSTSRRIAQAQLPIVLEPAQAASLADTWLFETWAAREEARFTLAPSMLALEAGDIIAVENEGAQRTFRITEIAERGERSMRAINFDGSVYDTASNSSRRPVTTTPPPSGLAVVEFLDLPLLRGDEPEAAGYVAASASPWPGEFAFFRSPETTGYVIGAVASRSAILGQTLAPLARGPTSLLDWGNEILVELLGGKLTSSTHLRMLSGSNVAALRNPSGGWEVVQFEFATLVGGTTYRLQRLLRGQAGTESEMVDSLAAGARFVLLDGAIARTLLTPDEIGLTLNWRYGPALRNIGHASYSDHSHAFVGIGRRPLSPVHARFRRDGSGIEISWIRRTRRGGDSWEAADVPLGEDEERYEVDILNGGSIVRTLVSNTSSVIYSDSQQIADFGGPATQLAVAIFQTNRSWGRSAPLLAQL